MAFVRILCGVDFSKGSLAAFQRAVGLARMGAGSLCIIHSIEAQPFVSDMFGADEMGKTAIKLDEKAAAALESLVASSGSALEGIPFVLGAEGATSLEQIVIGSTAERVMKGALCSVLIVRN
jgi:nucleotide-binding universal stress UspA family protein